MKLIRALVVFCIPLLCCCLSFIEKQKLLAQQQWEMRENEGLVEPNEEREVEYEYYYESESNEESTNKKKRGFIINHASIPQSIVNPIIYNETLEYIQATTKCLMKDQLFSNVETIIEEESTNANNDQNAPTTSSRNYKQMQEAEKQKREILEQKAKEQRLPEKGAIQVGSDCESLVCGACKYAVEEFGAAVFKAIDDPKVVTMYDLVSGFCDRKDITSKYKPSVKYICDKLFNEEDGYADMVVKVFEKDTDYENIMNVKRMQAKQKEICLGANFCQQSQFQIDFSPRNMFQQHWNTTCFLCRAIAFDMEEKVSLPKTTTEAVSIGLIEKVCDRLELSLEQEQLCREMITGKTKGNMAWLCKIHGEAVSRGEKSVRAFVDRLCEDKLKMCEKWINPDLVHVVEMKEEDMVFF